MHRARLLWSHLHITAACGQPENDAEVKRRIPPIAAEWAVATAQTKGLGHDPVRYSNPYLIPPDHLMCCTITTLRAVAASHWL
eukprot:scaffold121701_cov41-Prasinocladus_malaysianus.AAC.1